MIDVKDKKIVILGAARSGIAAAKLLHKTSEEELIEQAKKRKIEITT